MLFINILLLFLYEVDLYESTSRVYETLTNLHKLSSFDNLYYELSSLVNFYIHISLTNYIFFY